MDDPETILNALLANDAWIRSLARRLVGDQADADDVAQDAWVAALRNPPERIGSVAGWIGTVVRRIARSMQRDQIRRREREHSAPMSAAGADDRKNALRYRVATAVFGLEEPYRSAIYYRYFENLPPREIARRLDVGAAAVETRLRRGLRKLRARLDRDMGDRKTWCAALLPWLHPSGSPAAAASAATAMTGALSMGIKIKVAIAAAVVLVPTAVYVSWPQDDEARVRGRPVIEEKRFQTTAVGEKKEARPQGTSVTDAPAPSRPAKQPARQRDDVAALAAELQKLIESGSRSPFQYSLILRALVAIGTPEAIGVVLDCMENERCDFSLRPEHFARILSAVEDGRIYPAARRVIERNLEQGLNSWNYTHGYLKLVAKGGREGGEFLLTMLREGGQVASGAARAARDLKAHELADQFLAVLLEGNASVSMHLPTSLASWRDPEVTAKLTRIAQSPATRPRTKDQVYGALAEFSDSAEINTFANGYWSAPTPTDRAAIVGALSRLGRAGSKSDRTNAIKAALPVLQQALRDSDPRVWRRAVSVIGDAREFKTREILLALEQLHARITTPEEKRDVARALNKTRRHLR